MTVEQRVDNAGMTYGKKDCKWCDMVARPIFIVEHSSPDKDGGRPGFAGVWGLKPGSTKLE